MAKKPPPAGTILLADDDQLLCEINQAWLEDANFKVRTVNDGEACLAALTETLPDAVCLDLVMPGLNGFETLRRIKAHHPKLPVIVMTAQSGVQPAVEAMKLGAYDYLTKPIERTKLVTEIAHAVEQTRMALKLTHLEREIQGRGYPGIIGISEPMKALFRRLDRIAGSDITVLIHGESGSGKELVAQAIHRDSGRREGPLISLSCAAIPETLQESELFGHEKGAFTGAAGRRIGCFERADGGTLFLDEIGELTASLQAKLLRVLQERTFQRVGGSSEIKSDFRLLAATNKDLQEEVEAGRFRSDLYYRVAVMELGLPPLRDRLDDVSLLTEHFIGAATEGSRGKPPAVSATTLEVMGGYDWPGNVRELQNAIEHALVESNGGMIQPKHLPRRMGKGAVRAGSSLSRGGGLAPTGSSRGPQSLEDIERDAIAAAIERSEGNMSQVVRELGIGRTTLYRKLRKYGFR